MLTPVRTVVVMVNRGCSSFETGRPRAEMSGTKKLRVMVEIADVDVAPVAELAAKTGDYWNRWPLEWQCACSEELELAASS